ncbi:MAG TPA: polysaccharide biosynthesis/export family protein [Pyrinomonadaceae bacterium]|nr:polysaccharide biosynthesis/export family protein [Pyrinomonadaceae bacterium]
MNKSALKFVIIAILCAVAFTLESYAQTVPANSNKNFPFSQNPKRKPKTAEPVSNPIQVVVPGNSNTQVAAGEGGYEGRSSAQKLASVSRVKNSASDKNSAVAKNAGKPATELYRVGTGDILDIKLLNSDTKESTLFTVMEDGSIDYPLAGGVVQVSGLTNDEVEELLAARVTLYENPELSVTVRSFASHSVTVLGQVEKPGNKSLRREAVPLYVLLAEVVPNSLADKVMITRADRQTINIDLNDSGANDTLIYPGDMIKITSAAAIASSGTQFYYINGVQNPGEKSFRSGITLTQAILACGGMVKQSASKITISRQNGQGMLSSASHNLKDIKDGKAPDPVLQPGDRIEAKN